MPAESKTFMLPQTDITEQPSHAAQAVEIAPLPDTPHPAQASSVRARLLPHILTIIAFTLITMIATWPMFPNLGGYLMDRADPLLTVWGMAWQGHALATNPLGLFDSNVYYPFRGTLAFDELSFSEAVLAAPFYWLLGNPILSHNIVVFGAFIISGYGVWLLVRELTGSAWAGLVGGAAFAFSFYMLNHLPHTTLLSAEWLPFILLSAYKVIWTRSWRWAWALAAFFTLQALSSHYLAFYSAMLLGLFVVYYWFAQRKLFSLAFFGKLAASMAVSALLVLPIALPYVRGQASQDFRRDLFQVERFSNTLTSFLAVFRGNPIYQKLLAPFADPGPWAIERSAFPGLAVLVLAGLGVVWASRYPHSLRGSTEAIRQTASHPSDLGKHAAFYLIVALISVLLSLGPTLQLTYPATEYDPNAIRGVLPLPYALLYEWVPGFQSMRVAARVGVLLALALAVLAGIGAFFLLGRLTAWVKRRNLTPLLVPTVAILMALLPVVESWSAPLDMEPLATRSAVPPVYRWLAAQPPTVILEYPMVYYKPGYPNVAMGNTYQYFSTYHWQKLVNGSLAIRPYAYSAIVNEVQDCFPCPRSLDALWALGVEYVVAHLDSLSGPQRTDFAWRSTNPAGKVVNDFVLVKDFGSDRVYRITSPGQVGQLVKLVPPGASLLLANPENDPIRASDGSTPIGGGYIAALAYFLRDHPQYGDPDLSFGQPVHAPDPLNQPDYALLWANQDPTTEGYLPQNLVWSNEHVALYKRGRGIAYKGNGP